MPSPNLPIAALSLDDKYTVDRGRIYLTGTQALVRLALTQSRADQLVGLNTGGYISGYRGSPLGGLDQQLWHADKLLKEHNVHFVPGLNEDLAATAVWGTQQVGKFKGANVDGVFAFWYGKGPGVDRSGDALRHANLMGTSPNGGVLALAGDDHGAKSSSTAHQTEFAFVDAMIPVLSPANVQEVLDYGLMGFALSRFSGCWVALKTLADTVDSSASVWADPSRSVCKVPTNIAPPSGGLNLQYTGHQPLEQEDVLHNYRIPAVIEWARINGINRTIHKAKKPRLAIVTTGKAWLDVTQALHKLGLDEQALATLGVSVFKVGMPWPLEPTEIRAFAEGHSEVLVIEEKRALIESQLKEQFYSSPPKSRPVIVGKFDQQGLPLIPSHGILDSQLLAPLIIDRIRGCQRDNAAAEPLLQQLQLQAQPTDCMAPPDAPMNRLPHFCSGCPHNRSTLLPEGSRALAGIGCHYMALWMNRPGETFTQMGGEGLTWVGQAHFTDEKHVFVNLGDGTYFHSGSLAIRAAVAAKINVTYKILYNDAVAMTGGQPVDGMVDVPGIVTQVFGEGVARVVVLAEDPSLYPRNAFPAGVTVKHRRHLDEMQRELRETAGCTVLVYDQTCAAEKRRRRRIGEYPDPPKRAFINQQVCEGCGDCGVQSSCVSIVPVETPLGRKREIDQASCNKDFSCVDGFCPSFVTVHGGALRKPDLNDSHPDHVAARAKLDQLPIPSIVSVEQQPHSMLVTGVGGTGIVTVGALLGVAAHVEGKGCTIMDMAGIAQKGGAVTSHVRIGHEPEAMQTPRIPAEGTDLLLGCDIVVATGKDAMSTLKPGRSKAVVSTTQTITGDFTENTEWHYPDDAMRGNLQTYLGEDAVEFFNARKITEQLTGNSFSSNLFMLGYAAQRGMLPVHVDSIVEAIALNLIAVKANQQAFAWGRLYAHEPEAIDNYIAMLEQEAQQQAGSVGSNSIEATPETLDEIVRHRSQLLVEYQNQALADRYEQFIQKVAQAEQALGKSYQGLAETVASAYYKLLAVKDEYEVARLYSSGEFEQSLKQKFVGDFKIRFHLAPPILAKRDNQGKLLKREFGGWILPVFKILAKLRWLRNSAIDIFSWTAERRMEQRLISEYEAEVVQLLAGLNSNNHATAVKIAALPEKIRGYGHVKQANAAKAAEQRALLMAEFSKQAGS